MSKFAKVVMPLITKDIKLDDFSKESGFMDVYTIDPDRPGDYRSIYFVVNNEVRNGLSIDRARRFSKSSNIYGSYPKTIGNKGCIVYRFNMPKNVAKMKDGVIDLTFEEKARVLQFWGITSDIGRLLINNHVLSIDTDYAMPLADETPIFLEKLL